MTKLGAVIEAINMIGGIAIVETKGGQYLPIRKNCNTCKYKGTERTKDCETPSSHACDEWRAPL